MFHNNFTNDSYIYHIYFLFIVKGKNLVPKQKNEMETLQKGATRHKK